MTGAPGRPELPTGSVTMLFSDLQGSTALVQSLGPDWAAVLDRTRALCRDAWASAGGHELGTEGDSFFVVFADPGRAVAAAVRAQRAMAAEVWPREAVVAARMGLHTGSPTRHGDGYIGLDVHLAARVAGAAHGGQVLLSGATAAALSTPGDGVHLIDLGEHRLKDIPDRVPLLQLGIAGLPADFPPLSTASGGGNLPQGAQELVGRDGEVVELARLLVDGARVVSLTGPGGSGKTRLALAVGSSVAHRFPDGVWFVPAVTVTEARLLWSAIAQELDLPAVLDQPEQITAHLRRRKLLLVLDNLEQVAGAGDVVATLVAACPAIQVVATSRRTLQLREELEHAVPPLEVPASDASYDEVAASGAVQLFVRHARRVRRGFALTPDLATDVAALCRAVDGLPLAVELIAARSRTLSPAALLRRIDAVLDVSSSDRDRPERQRSLRSTIAWSHDLLPGQQQSVLAHLAVFAGTAGLESIEAVVPARVLAGADPLDVLSALAESSFVTVTEDADGEPRFGLLETVRRFALEQLEASGDRAAAERSFAQHFYDLAVRLRVQATHSYGAAAASFAAELGNLAQLVQSPGPVADARFPSGRVPSECVVALGCVLAYRFRTYRDGTAWAARALAAPGPVDPVGRLALLAGASVVHLETADYARVLELGRSAEEVWRALEAAPVELPTLGSRYHPIEARCIVAQNAGLAHLNLGALPDARASALAAIGLSELLPAGAMARSIALSVLMTVHEAHGDWALAAEVLPRIRELDADAGDAWGLVWFEVRMAGIEAHLGRRAESLSRLRRTFPTLVDLADTDLLVGAAEVLVVLVGADDPTASARLVGAMDVYRREHELPMADYARRILDADLAPIHARLRPQEWADAAAAGAQRDLVELLGSTLGP